MFFYAHSGIRYLVLLAGAGAVLYGLFLVVSGRGYNQTIQKLSSSFAGLIHLQLMVGIALGLSGRIRGALIGHVMVMFFAAAVAQIPISVQRRRPAEERTVLPFVIGGAVAMALVVLGIMSIGRPIFGSG